MNKITDFQKGYQIGLHDGENEAILKLQQNNKNIDLPSNETLYKIFDLLFQCKENDHKTSTCVMNSYEHYARYIALHWSKNA